MLFGKKDTRFKEKTTKFKKNKEKLLDKIGEMWYSVNRKSGFFRKMRVFVWFSPKTVSLFCAGHQILENNLVNIL